MVVSILVRQSHPQELPDLMATLTAGSFANGTGNLTYSLSGTPASDGTASFALNIGGQTCNLDVNISTSPVCRAKIDASTTGILCVIILVLPIQVLIRLHRVGEINGGYWQWGRKEQAAEGPIGQGYYQANGAVVSGWSTNYTPDESWTDGAKSVNDPCPAGYRVPTSTHWSGVLNTIFAQPSAQAGTTAILITVLV
jgi:hypothetical protein